MMRARRGAGRSQLPVVAGLAIACLGVGIFLAEDDVRVLLIAAGMLFVWVAEFLAFGELARGRLRFSRRRTGASTPDHEVLKVMRRVMHVRPEPHSRTAER